MLKGLLRCDRCNRNLYGYIKEAEGKNQRVYMCSSKRETFCGMRSINIDKLNKLVWNSVKGSHLLLKKKLREINGKGVDEALKQSQNKLEKIESGVQLLNKKLDNLIELYTEGRITKSQFDEKKQKYNLDEERLNQDKITLERENQMLEDQRGLASIGDKMETLFSRLKNLTEPEKADLLRLLVKDIKVNYDENLLEHTVTILINGSAEVIKQEIPIKEKPLNKGERKPQELDLWEPVVEGEPYMIEIDGEFIEFVEKEGKVKRVVYKNSIPREAIPSRNRTFTIKEQLPHAVTTSHLKSCGEAI